MKHIFGVNVTTNSTGTINLTVNGKSYVVQNNTIKDLGALAEGHYIVTAVVYENDNYTEYKKGLPEVGHRVMTEKGEGKVLSIDILKGTYRVDIPDVGIVEFTKDENESN